ncbi:hypothetical protein G5V59_14525 [Nocardioides sp. W3-2-3]|nr:hypothetical protein [Nocardioides convexus]NHA00764.1 hypothetical protein [Nocardioides convexus]
MPVVLLQRGGLDPDAPSGVEPGDGPAAPGRRDDGRRERRAPPRSRVT